MTTELDLLALATETDTLSRRLHGMYQDLRTAGHAYAWASALQARDALDELAEQLRDDALNCHPDGLDSDDREGPPVQGDVR